MSAPAVKTTQAFLMNAGTCTLSNGQQGAPSIDAERSQTVGKSIKKITHEHFPNALLFQLIVILTQNYAFL